MAKMEARNIANAFIERAGQDQGERGVITPLKLQKVLYYAQGWYLAFNNGNPLFDDKAYAWQCPFRGDGPSTSVLMLI